MSAATRRKLPWVLGIVVLAFSAVAATLITGTADAQPPADPKAAKKPDGPGGLTILGTVDADPGVLRVDPPAVAGALVVRQILVEEGAKVAKDDPLIQFDDDVFQKALAEAKAALKEAEWTKFKADYNRGYEQPQLLAKQKLAVEAAKIKWDAAKTAQERGLEAFNRVLDLERNLSTGTALTDSEKDRRRKENQDLLKAETLVKLAEKDHEKEVIDQQRLTALLTAPEKGPAPADADPTIATAAVERYKAKVAQAQAMVDACRVTARMAGTVEQFLATPGMLFGPGTRTPAMQLVPAGERIVRAEVDPEFVARVADKAGKKVTITDSHHFSNTYEGVVVRVGTSLLPKRGGGDLLAGPPAKVLECRIKVLDATPPGKPPLVVGQPVRVVFGQ